MLHFRIGRIPVEVHFTHVLISAAIALGFRPHAASPQWPARVLSGQALPSLSGALVAYVALWVGALFLVVLLHELGHAAVALRFGYRPRVRLLGIGGQTDPNANESIPWHREVLFLLAGPAVSLLLAAAALSAWRWVGPKVDGLSYALAVLGGASAFWSAYNLLPIAPLDGGRAATVVLVRAFGRRGFLFAQLLAIVAAAVLAAVVMGFVKHPLLSLLMLAYAFRAVAGIHAYVRGDAPALGPTHPMELLLQQAGALFEQPDLEPAETFASLVAQSDAAPALRGRAHHLLGWIALKKGQGRAALDHFSQSQGQPIEPHALAAAFSLVGDDPRALPLWEQAYQRAPTATLLHELAGTLIRLNRTSRALSLPCVQPATAFSCAERVLFLRGQYAQAAQVGEAALEVQPTRELAYAAACAHARAGDGAAAVRLLARALELGFTNAEYAETDADLASLRENAAFGELLGRMRKTARG